MKNNPPKWLTKELTACFRGRACSDEPESYYVWNQKAADWLYKHFGLTADLERVEYMVTPGIYVHFDWRSQNWATSAGPTIHEEIKINRAPFRGEDYTECEAWQSHDNREE